MRDFLGSVSVQLSELFGDVATLLPSEAISQLATLAYSVHGTLDADPLEFEAMKIDRPIAEQKIIEGWQTYVSNFRTPVNLQSPNQDGIDLVEYVPTRILEAFGQWNRDAFQRNVSVFFADDNGSFTASAAEIANLSAIIELLVANAGKHTGLNRGTIQVRGLIRGGRPFVFVRYTSHVPNVEASILRSFGSVPIEKDGGVRYGAFLLGEMVRSANGLLYVQHGGEVGAKLHRLQLVIALPVSMEVN
ncbi:hypothetical protein GCM10007385_02570 [Tateyamaria omphalii]|nr:hypothetical protein GCM10007385_02570 [Tateyamaria omphalii]